MNFTVIGCFVGQTLGGAFVSVYQGGVLLCSGTTTVTTPNPTTGAITPNLVMPISAENNGQPITATIVATGFPSVSLSLSGTCDGFSYFQQTTSYGFHCNCCAQPDPSTLTMGTPHGNVTLTLGTGWTNAGSTMPNPPDANTYYGSQTITTTCYPPYMYRGETVPGCPNPSVYPWSTIPASGPVTIYYTLTACSLKYGIQSCNTASPCYPWQDVNGAGTGSYYQDSSKYGIGIFPLGFTPATTTGTVGSNTCNPFAATYTISGSCNGAVDGTYTINGSSYGSYAGDGHTPTVGMMAVEPRTTNPLEYKARPSGLEHELVVSRYREPVEWSNDSPIPVCLYDRWPMDSDPDYLDHVRVRRLDQNVGREFFSYLTHIVENYDDLAEWTYFVQGNTHSGVELFGRIDFPFTGVAGLTKEYTSYFPSPEIKKLDKSVLYGDYEVRYGDAKRVGGRSEKANRVWLKSVWNTFFDCPQPKDWRYVYGAEVAVPRKSILSRPLAYWRYVLKLISQPEYQEEMTVASGWAMETVWLYLLDGDKYPGKLPNAPGVFDMAKNLLGSVAKQIGSGNPKASDDLQAKRREICEACPLLVNDRCMRCGCVAMDAKRSWLTSECPDGKW